MQNEKMILVFEGDDESIAWDILSFAGMREEFPDADFALLDESDIKNIAYEHADYCDENIFDSGAPGGCYGIFKFYARDPEKFRNTLREALRPMCIELIENNS